MEVYRLCQWISCPRNRSEDLQVKTSRLRYHLHRAQTVHTILRSHDGAPEPLFCWTPTRITYHLYHLYQLTEAKYMSLQPCDRSSVPGNLKTSSLCGHAAVGVHRAAECQATVICSVFASLGLYCDFYFQQYRQNKPAAISHSYQMHGNPVTKFTLKRHSEQPFNVKHWMVGHYNVQPFKSNLFITNSRSRFLRSRSIRSIKHPLTIAILSGGNLTSFVCFTA